MKKVLWLTLAALALGAVYWFRAPAPDAAQVKKPPPAVPVTVARVNSRDWPVWLDAIGRGEAVESVMLKSRVDGQVASVLFREGAAVAAGEVLLRLDPADFQARVHQAQANLARAQALLDKARADVARYQSLLEQQFISQEKVADMHAAAAAAAATLEADRAALDLARQQLAHCLVRAPFAGVAGARRVHAGASVKANDTELLEINRLRPLQVSFAVPEKHLQAIHAARSRAGLTAEIRIPGEKSAIARGPVVFFDSGVDPATATLRMKAQVTNADGRLAPGQFLDVRLYLDTLRGAVVAPAEAVQQGPEGSFVYVLGEDAGAKPRKVKLGPLGEGLAVITQGLAAGETVVTDGHSRLTPGAKVKVKEPGRAVSPLPASSGSAPGAGPGAR